MRTFVAGALLAGTIAVSFPYPVSAQNTEAYRTEPLQRAEQLLKSGKADAASSIYEAYLRQHPSSLAARMALAELEIRRFEYARARTHLETALAQYPDAGEVAAMLGHLYQQWSKTPVGTPQNYQARAEEHFRQAQATDPDSYVVLTYLADWQLERDDLVSAERNLERAISLNRTYVPAHLATVRFYIKTRDLGRAKEAAMHALELDPYNAETYFLTARLLGLANQPAEAVRYAEKSEQIDFGRNPERDFFLASQLEKLGDLPKAAQYYETMTAYVPKQADVWQKLGEIYETTGQDEKSLAAYQKAIALNPAYLTNLKTAARQDTRQEKFSRALQEWRRLIRLQPQDTALRDEAFGAMASLHYLNYIYATNPPDKLIGQDIQSVTGTLNQPDAGLETRRLDLVKMKIAQQQSITPALKGELAAIAGAQDPAVAGEAAFLTMDLKGTQDKLDLVDGLEAEEYARIADRLLLDGELVYSKVFYQRAYELKPSPDIETGMKRVQSKQSLASQKLGEGNTLFESKKYTEAAQKYEEAARIYPQWDTVYLRLGDTYEQLNRWNDSAKAYAQAVELSPALMNSEGFAKHYRKLQKKAK